MYLINVWHKLTLAFAMSNHKSQGSEFQVVILPITHQSRRLLQRNPIYTAITRSKRKLVMLGELAAFDYAIKNEGDKRKTYRVQRCSNDKLAQETAEKQVETPQDTATAEDQNYQNVAVPADTAVEEQIQLTLDIDNQ